MSIGDRSRSALADYVEGLMLMASVSHHLLIPLPVVIDFVNEIRGNDPDRSLAKVMCDEGGVSLRCA